MRSFALLLGATALAAGLAAGAAEPVKVYAAGSLRDALTDVAKAFTESTGTKVEFEFGPSGTLRARLAQGARADVFASANMEHPQALAASGRARAARMSARNRLCAIAPRSYGVNTGNLLPGMCSSAPRSSRPAPTRSCHG